MLQVREIRKVIEENRDVIEALEDLDRTGALARPNYKEKVNFTIDMEVMRLFRSYCKKEGYKMSTIVERLILKEIKKDK